MRRVVVEPQPILWRRLSGRRLLRRFLSELWLWLVFAGRGGDDDHQRSAGDYRTCRNVDPDLLRNGAGPQTPRRQEEGEAETQAQSTLRLLKISEEHTSDLTSLIRNSYAVFCLKK